MMIKIIGAALIVSGGYFIGKVATLQRINRLNALNEIYGLFCEYEVDLKEFRSSLDESLLKKGTVAQKIINFEKIDGLLSEDEKKLEATVNQLRMGTYQESIDANGAFIEYLSTVTKKLEEENATIGKALPLVFGAIGLLVAVLLF